VIDDLFENGVDARYEKALQNFFSGFINMSSGNYEIAKQLTKDCLTISQECGFYWMVLNALELLGDIESSTGSPRQAKFWFEKYMAEAKAMNNHSGEINALRKLGWAARQLMAYDEARNHYHQSIRLAKTYENPLEELYALQQLGFLGLLLGEFEEAIPYFRDAVAISDQMGVPQRTIASIIHIGFSLWMSGEFDQAEIVIQETLDRLAGKPAGSRVFPMICLAEYQIITGRYQEGKTQLQTAHSITKNIFMDHFFKGRLYRNWAG